MLLNNTSLKKLEDDFTFSLTPEQKSILLFWFGSDSKFGWSKLDFLIGIQRVRRLYPDHRDKLYKGPDGILDFKAFDFEFDYDNNGNPVLRFYDDDDDDDDDDFAF